MCLPTLPQFTLLKAFIPAVAAALNALATKLAAPVIADLIKLIAARPTLAQLIDRNAFMACVPTERRPLETNPAAPEIADLMKLIAACPTPGPVD